MRSDVDNTASDEVVVARTPFGKEVAIVREGGNRLFRFKMRGGGELPAVLQGQFTGMQACERALAAYENARPLPEEKPEAKEPEAPKTKKGK